MVLKSEYRQTRTELAAGLTPQGIRSTVKDPRLWKMKDGRPRPEYVYAKTNEDEYNIYENRAVKALIDRVIRLLDIPTEQAKGGVKNLYEAYFQSSSLSKLDLVKLMDMDLFKTSDGRAFENYKKLYYLRAKFSQLKNSAFYKIMSNCPAFAGAIEATNLFLHNKNYNACFLLWRFLDEFCAGSVLSQEQIGSVYAAFVSLAAIGAYVRMGFKIVKDAEIGRIDEGFSLKGFGLENELFKVTFFRVCGKSGNRGSVQKNQNAAGYGNIFSHRRRTAALRRRAVCRQPGTAPITATVRPAWSPTTKTRLRTSNRSCAVRCSSLRRMRAYTTASASSAAVPW